jgi:heme/copper-type cytochrome/quinol oxidase subunit 1
MRDKIFRIHHLFLLSGIILSLPLLLAPAQETLDLLFHSTYIIIAYRHIGAGILVLHVFYYLVFLFSRNYMNKLLGILQLTCSFIFFSWLLLVMWNVISLNDVPRRYYSNSSFEFPEPYNIALIFSTGMLALSMLFFVLNVAYSVAKLLSKKQV